MYYTFIEFIILLYTFLIISFAWYNKYMIRQVSFSKFSEVLSAFSYASAIGNLWSTCLGANIFSMKWCMFSFRHYHQKFNNTFSCFVKRFKIYNALFCPFDFAHLVYFYPFLCHSNLIYFILIFLLFPALYCHLFKKTKCLIKAIKTFFDLYFYTYNDTLNCHD